MPKQEKLSMNCVQCGTPFKVAQYRKDTAKYCSPKCRSTGCYRVGMFGKNTHLKGNKFSQGMRPTNAFPSQHIPWNRNLKGIHLSPGSEIKKGQRLKEYVPIGTEKIRVHRGVKRWHVKVADPNVWELRARVVWEKHHGKIPHGKLIHHHDRDTLNDDIDNLKCLTRAEHLKEHRGDQAKAA